MIRLYRLKSEKDFARVAKSRKKAYGKYLGLKMRENKLSHSRFGIVVGLKISKKAVLRNRLRRKIREIIRKHIVNARDGYDVMVLGNKSALEVDFNVLEKELLGLFKKIGLMK